MKKAWVQKSPELFGVESPWLPWLLAIVTLCFVAFCPLSFAADLAPAKNILVLYSFSDRGVFAPLDDLKAAVHSRVPSPVNFYVHYMEAQAFENAGYEEGLSETLSSDYRDVKLDLVIVAGYPALQFAVKYRDRIFPGVPVLFSYVHASRLRDKPLWPGVTGITTSMDVRGTLDLALKLHPDTHNLAVVAGTSEFERFWLAAVRDEFRPYAAKVTLIEIVGTRTDQVLQEIGALPPHTVVLFQVAPRDSAQPAIGVYDTIAIISQRFSTYCIFRNYCVDHGGIGGSYSDYLEQNLRTGELAARILSGERPENIPVIHDSGTRVNVDGRQLRRWNIAESALPPGTIVLYREPPVWERYEKRFIGCALLVLVQAMLIFALLRQRARKRRSEASLHESENRFHLMADTSPALIWMCNKDGKLSYLNETGINFIGGRETDADLGDQWTASIHADDLDNFLAANARGLKLQKGFSKEYRLRRRDGGYRWMLDIAAPRTNGDGAFAGFVGSASDVSDQKLAQEALAKMGGKLIEAQEKERTRIARELHDDICQRLALLSLELDQVAPGVNGSATHIADIRRHCSEICADVQALSHELHSSKLDYLGVVAAISSLCRGLSEQQNVDVAFTEENIPDSLPRDVSLCLFRVAQEALHNAVKYSGTNQFSVDLRATANDIRLEIRDTGSGFDLEKARGNGGLGLMSMQERVHMVHGTFSIQSNADCGTTIVANVPLVREMQGSVTTRVSILSAFEEA